MRCHRARSSTLSQPTQSLSRCSIVSLRGLGSDTGGRGGPRQRNFRGRRASQAVRNEPPRFYQGVEIDSRVADSSAALIVDQVRAGLVVRMAVLYDLLTKGPVVVETAVMGVA